MYVVGLFFKVFAMSVVKSFTMNLLRLVCFDYVVIYST